MEDVRNKDLSLPGLCDSAKYIKKMAALQENFMKYHSLSTWEEAEEKFPIHTRKERLQPFMHLKFSSSNAMPLAFVAFCKEALQHNVLVSTSQPGTSPG